MIWGTSLLYVDTIGIILLYERLSSILGRRILLRFFVAGAAILTFDHIGFYGALKVLTDAPANLFWGGLVAKMSMTLLFVAMTGVYLRMVRTGADPAPGKEIADIFADLTFRERYQALLARSGRDALTGVLDRSRLEIDGPELVRDAVGRNIGVSLIMVDADHFKALNDGYGHLEGDKVLKAIASELMRTVRTDDGVYRFGGEEFIVICRGLDPRQTLDVAERIRAGISRLGTSGEGLSVTVSIGVATAPADGISLIELISAADRRLYRAKADGRNRVVGA